MFVICFYVPESHLVPVKQAMFTAGGGRIGDYDHCAWQCLGEGQYRPLENSQPYSGNQGQISYEQEYKVEMVCLAARLEDVLRAMKNAHPYEEPAYYFWEVNQE